MIDSPTATKSVPNSLPTTQYTHAEPRLKKHWLAGTLPAELIDFLYRFDDYERLRERAHHFMSDNRVLLSNLTSRDPPVRSTFPERAFTLSSRSNPSQEQEEDQRVSALLIVDETAAT